jgi:hypothetical protein
MVAVAAGSFAAVDTAVDTAVADVGLALEDRAAVGRAVVGSASEAVVCMDSEEDTDYTAAVALLYIFVG